MTQTKLLLWMFLSGGEFRYFGRKGGTTSMSTWNPNDPCFGWKGPCFGGFEPQIKDKKVPGSY